jgi:uncharacterized phage protein (TIGR02218 family)
MSRVFFSTELEGVATFWRIARRDGCTLGFTSHDRDLWFDGVLHRAAPGMVPSSIRLSASLDADDADVQGALSHDAIKAADLAAGRYDGALFEIGVVDWETRETATLYHGVTGAIAVEEGGFTAELQSAKAHLDVDLVPRTSPTCRAAFCGPGCNLNPMRYTHDLAITQVDADAGEVTIADATLADRLRDGWLRWIDGPHAGLTMQVMAVDQDRLTLDQPLATSLLAGTTAQVREGCDHTIATCAARFANAANFQGEPFLPGNDLLTRYPPPSG